MKKQNITKIIIIMAIMIVITLSSFIIKNRHSNYELRCKNEMYQTKSISNDKILVLQTNYYLFLYKNGRGSVVQRGELMKDGINFLVHRELNFNYIAADKYGMYRFTILNGEKFPEDNVPDSLAKYFPYLSVKPSTSTLPRYIHFTHIDDDLLLINELTAPYLLCQRF